MNDILPDVSADLAVPRKAWLQGHRQSYGYDEIRLPLLEQTELFRRSIGEVTDIVEKEMYTFEDRGGESLTLRPEATAGMVSPAGITNGLFAQPAAEAVDGRVRCSAARSRSAAAIGSFTSSTSRRWATRVRTSTPNLSS